MSLSLTAQNYEQVTVPFKGVNFSSAAFADIDGDNDLDLLITGNNEMFQPISKIYRNDGNGTYIEDSNSTIIGVSESAIAFSDVDGDSDEDVIVTGMDNTGTKIAKLYLNDGNGVFTEDLNTILDGVSQSSVAFIDIDNDDDEDLLITGLYQFNSGKSKLYLNDGSGVFTEIENTSLVGTKRGSISFADVDGDSDQDVLITGRGVFSQDQITKLYLNNGSGEFTESNNDLPKVSESSTVFMDVDGDNDQDLLITGTHNSSGRYSGIFINNGNGVFTEKIDSTFEQVNFSSVAFSDIDSDNDNDVIISGENESLDKSSFLYLNDGVGNFSKFDNPEIDGVYQGSVVFADVNGDDNNDLLVCGYSNSFEYISNLYLNQETTSTIEVKKTNTNFYIYPNPTESQSITIRSSNLIDFENIELLIVDSSGTEMQTIDSVDKTGTNESTISIVNLEIGVYYLVISYKDRKETIEFVIK